MSHTPGPWTHLDGGHPTTAVFYDKDRGYIAECSTSTAHSEETNIANARLIAAAPEMLECLTEAVDRMLGSSPAIKNLRERSLAAIRKATT